MDPSDLPSECDENMLKAVARRDNLRDDRRRRHEHHPTDPHKIRSCRGGLHGMRFHEMLNPVNQFIAPGRSNPGYHGIFTGTNGRVSDRRPSPPFEEHIREYFRTCIRPQMTKAYVANTEFVTVINGSFRTIHKKNSDVPVILLDAVLAHPSLSHLAHLWPWSPELPIVVSNHPLQAPKVVATPSKQATSR
jgi:hypothetical protein